MLESNDQIVKALEVGDDLVFSTYTLKGFVSSNVYNIQSYDSPYDLEKQDFYVRMATSDFMTKGLVPGIQFTVVVSTVKFTFSIMNYTHDMTGWSKINLNFIGVASV